MADMAREYFELVRKKPSAPEIARIPQKAHLWKIVISRIPLKYQISYIAGGDPVVKEITGEADGGNGTRCTTPAGNNWRNSKHGAEPQKVSTQTTVCPTSSMKITPVRIPGDRNDVYRAA